MERRSIHGRRCPSSLLSAAVTLASWPWPLSASSLLVGRIGAFSIPARRGGPIAPAGQRGSEKWIATNNRSDTRILKRSIDGRPPLAVLEQASSAVGTMKGTTAALAEGGAKKANPQPKTRKHQQRRSQHQSRPFSDLTLDELKQLTEYHLSQNIRSSTEDSEAAVGSMSPAQMHEFSRLISSWSKLESRSRWERRTAAEMAEQCFLELVEERRAGNEAARKVLTGDVHYLVVRAWLKVGGFKELVHATSLLDSMERHGIPAESTKCYAAVLDGWCKSKSYGSEVEAEKIMRRMGGAADVRHYNNVMNRVATGGGRNAGREAERLLGEMIDAYKRSLERREENEGGSGNGNGTATSFESAGPAGMLAPNQNSFNTAIKAYANAGGRDAAKNAQRILNMMEDPDEVVSSLRIAPDKISYTSVLMAWANTAKSNRGRGGRGDGDAGDRAEGLLQRMTEMYEESGGDERMNMKPDTVAYNSVLKVWGRSGHPGAGERSVAILDKMIRLYEAGDSDVIPDDVTFNSVIHNIANSNTADSPQRAMRLLERMQSSYESGLIRAKPDIISYNSVLNAFAKRGGPESAKRAEELLDSLEKRSLDNDSNSLATEWDIRPDVYSYNIVISAWSTCGYANNAVALLDRMTTLTNEGKPNLRPDLTTYNTVLHAWSQSNDRNAPVKALGLLEIMLRLHEGGDRSAKPDVQSFSTVMNAFSKSRFPRKAKQTRRLLRRMQYLHEGGEERMRPNVYVYAAVLNACAYTFGRNEEKEEALRIGIEMYEELQASPEVEANHVAYGSFVRVCRRLHRARDASERDRLISEAFRRCCADGQLGEYVLTQLRAVPELYMSLLRDYIVDGEVSHQDLPSSWKCNVKEQRKRRSDRQFSRQRNSRKTN